MALKLYISADLEGVVGVTSPLQCASQPDPAAYQQAVNQLGKEVRAVADAAWEAGATEIVVNDSHCTMANLGVHHLGERVSLLSGKPKICAMSAGLDASFDAAIYVGYHAKAGTENGILNHTFHSKLFDVSVNGVSYGEGGINALYASLVHQVPVVLASGDQAFCAEIREVIPAIQTVQTKTSISTTAALSRPQADVMADYFAATKQVIQNQAAWKANLLKLKKPYHLQITFVTSLDADCAMMQPCLKRVDGRTVTFETDHFQTLYQVLQSSYALLAYTAYMGV